MGTCQICSSSRSLGHKSWFCAGGRNQGRTARERSNKRDIQIRNRTVEVEDKIHPSVFSLSIDNTGKSRYFLINKYFDPTLRLNDVCKATRQCCRSAVNTSFITDSHNNDAVSDLEVCCK